VLGKGSLIVKKEGLLIATPDQPFEKQIDDIADWLQGDSGVSYGHISDELTAWFEEIKRRLTADPLDDAWAEAEAICKETGRSFLRLTMHNPKYYWAGCNWVPGELGEDFAASTPVAALRGLIAKLEEWKTHGTKNR
jgi:hypothetical protein